MKYTNKGENCGRFNGGKRREKTIEKQAQKKPPRESGGFLSAARHSGMSGADIGKLATWFKRGLVVHRLNFTLIALRDDLTTQLQRWC